MSRVSSRCFAGVLLALVIGATPAGARGVGRPDTSLSMPVMTEHDFPTLSLRLKLPKGWAAFEANYNVEHYRQVFLCLNSIGSSTLRVEDKATDARLPGGLRGSMYNEEVVAEQLPVGAVYIDIGFFEGPGGGNYFPEPDNYESSVKSISPSDWRIMWKTEQLTFYAIQFIQWGRPWSVFMFSREPVAATDRQAAFDLLRAFAFIDRPITNEMRAVAAAFDSLPETVRDSVLNRNDAEWCGGVYPRSERRGSGFMVMLERAKRRWTYFVSREGTVRLVARSDN